MCTRLHHALLAWATLFLAVPVLAVLGLAGRATAQPPQPDVLLISVDTLRPDALGWVAGRNSTPACDALAAAGFRFPQAVSPVPLTLPAHASLFTGLIPRRHGVRINGHVLSGDLPTLAGQLRAAGYATAAVVGGYPLRAPFGLDRGFDHYDDHLESGGGRWQERPAEAVVDAALAWLRGRPPGGPPWLLFVHFYDAHDPYTPPAQFRRPGPRGDYDGEVAVIDAAVGRLFRELDALAGARPRLTVFTSDHGESLGEHGEATHGFFVYDATVQVPLVLHFPGRLVPGESPAAARLVDVAPTVLDLLGLPPLPDVDGVSLRPWLEGRARQVPPAAYLETLEPFLGYGWAPLRALRTEHWKLIAAPRPELYDLRADGGEQANRVDAERRVAAGLRDQLRVVEARGEAAAVSAGEEAAALRALGYTGSGESPASAAAVGLADPKDRLALKAELEEAEALYQAGQPAAALTRYAAVLAVEPANRLALLRSGQAQLALDRPAEAVAPLASLLRLDASQAEARYALADALMRSGDIAAAAREWRQLASLQPRRAVAWSNLGTAEFRLRRWREAVEALERALVLDPEPQVFRQNLAAARFELARQEAQEGRLDRARELLTQALAATPALQQRARRDPLLLPLLP